MNMCECQRVWWTTQKIGTLSRAGVSNINIGGTSMEITNDYTLQNEDWVERTC